jgi:hypothetical protein
VVGGVVGAISADRFGDRRTVLAHAGSIISSTGIAGTTPVDGSTISNSGKDSGAKAGPART